jgi:hypothetical protein
VDRLQFMLKTMRMNDPQIFEYPIYVIEDPSGFTGVTEGYIDLCEENDLHFERLKTWSNMHGAARKAFDIAMKYDDPTWIIYLGDDLAITKHSLTQMTHFLEQNDLKSIGLVQFPYWNSHEYRADKRKWFYESTDWTKNVPVNPHWGEKPPAFPYLNVNGAGFACRTEMYRQVGGFAEGTWCLDESISVKCWLETEYSIVALPGHPFVHYFGASTSTQPKHDMYTEERWIEAMGHSKWAFTGWSYAKMYERKARVEEEMKECKYYGQ